VILVIIYGILFILVLGAVFYFGKPKQKKKQKLDTANIQIAVENKQVRKTRAIEESEVIKEAESHFRILALKNPYSPLPYKVLAEFYIKNGLKSEAIKKYEQMIAYLNKDLDLIKAEPIISFLEENQRTDLSDKIKSFYAEKG